MNQITPQQRMLTTQQGGKPDKLPIFVAAANGFICNYYGLTVDEYLCDPQRAADGHTALINDFELDGCVVASGYILYGCGPEMGVEWKFSGGEFPGFGGGPLQSEDDLDRLRVPDSPSQYFAHYLEVIRRVTAELGDSHFINANILGPFASVCFLRGIEQALLETAMKPDFSARCLEFGIKLSKYFGKEVVSTRVPFTTLNEIFLTPQMVSPATYHSMIAPAVQEVQKSLEPHNSPNLMGAFIGKSGDPDSRKGGMALYDTFFGTNESVESVKEAYEYKLPGMPFPLSISGRMLDSWPVEKIIAFLDESLHFLVHDKKIYPSINLISLQAENKRKAMTVAVKIKALIDYRNKYKITG